MNDIIGNTAQELADHLDDLRDTGEGVPDFDGEDRTFPVTDVTDAEVDKGLGTIFAPSVSFLVTVAGQRLRVTVAAVEAERKEQPCFAKRNEVHEAHPYDGVRGTKYQCPGVPA
jgi:hypothetical protein